MDVVGHQGGEQGGGVEAGAEGAVGVPGVLVGDDRVLVGVGGGVGAAGGEGRVEDGGGEGAVEAEAAAPQVGGTGEGLGVVDDDGGGGEAAAAAGVGGGGGAGDVFASELSSLAGEVELAGATLAAWPSEPAIPGR